MKVVILAGGLGTRLSEYTDKIPKPMVRIGGKPILWHIMEIFARFGHKDFYVALGYKGESIKNYFTNYRYLTSDISVDLATGAVNFLNSCNVNWNVTLVDTGEQTMTGGRLKRLKRYIGDDAFLCTYGDGLANIDLEALIKFHRYHGKLATVTAVRPTARFGELFLEGANVQNFQEKPQLGDGWINGGFFVFEPDFLDLICSDETMLEREPLEAAAKMGELMGYRHSGFWQCMDNKRDHDLLESYWRNGAPWVSRAD